MSFYGKWDTYKIIYNPKVMNGGIRGVAFVEAGDRGHALYTFSQQYAGMYSTVDSVEKITNNSF